MESNTRTLQGVIEKISNDNTVKVKVERKSPHPLYKKIIRTHKKYLVHCTNTEAFEVGDEVIIRESKPISRNKSWVVDRLLKEENK